jgi:uncharacterized membrane protein
MNIKEFALNHKTIVIIAIVLLVAIVATIVILSLNNSNENSNGETNSAKTASEGSKTIEELLAEDEAKRKEAKRIADEYRLKYAQEQEQKILNEINSTY